MPFASSASRFSFEVGSTTRFSLLEQPAAKAKELRSMQQIRYRKIFEVVIFG
ncbi:hypothetical protein RBSWK_01096 [Rhodopirellula baltica SWK14]|uniref:Uncharacterized protein n=1 Tax=Rhodopirellula baltica SWK14 TaxID=993516 RepID=L7CPW2_RHOBT|nr:hypothetical protein RBSWK_01096 [Rhodopirellula baltica SWK14]